MRLLVTGVAGFIGAALSQRLQEEGHDVVGVDDFSTGHPANVPYGTDFIEGDLSDKKTFDQIRGPFDAILHLAGQSSGELSFLNPLNDLYRNVETTLNCIEFGKKHKIRKFLYASSMSVYGDLSGAASEASPTSPKSIYGVSKLASENYLRVARGQLRTVALRMFNVYGPGQNLENLQQGMVSIFLAMAIRDRHIEVHGSLNRYRDFVHINDVVNTWVHILYEDVDGYSVVNVGSGIKTSVRHLISRIVELNKGTSVEVVGSTPGDQHGVVANTSSLNRYVNVEDFLSFDEGLKEFDAWAKDWFRSRS
jgi:UDP-glucose 4-epimerase